MPNEAPDGGNLFDNVADPDSQAVTSFLEKYVGEGKKYKSVEDLAKGYEHADKFIGELKGELGGIKDFVAAQFEKMADERTRNIENHQPGDGGLEPKNPAAPPVNVEKEDLDARIAKALRDNDEQRVLKENSSYAEAVLVQHYGSKEEAVKAVQAKAVELGISGQFLADTAFRSPKALFNILGINPDETPASPNTPAPRNDVNPRALDQRSGQPKPGTWAYYQNLRKTDSDRYWAREVQDQLMKDAMAAGDAFYR